MGNRFFDSYAALCSPWATEARLATGARAGAEAEAEAKVPAALRRPEKRRKASSALLKSM